MKASLDTNVIIHLYKANMQHILFDVFSDGLLMYEQIRFVELVHHGKSILELVDKDIEQGRIELYTDERLKQEFVFKMFENNVKDNRLLFNSGDIGEVYAMSLAQTLGAFSLVTDDVKQGGPYMSLMQLDYNEKPFNFADVLILRYLLGIVGATQTIEAFDKINETSNLNWSFKGQLKKFVRRFYIDPYKSSEKEWFEYWTKKHSIRAMGKLKTLNDAINNYNNKNTQVT